MKRAHAPSLAGYFIAKGRAAARFELGDGGTCEDCERRVLSYPDTCDEGWARLRKRRFEGCKNWMGKKEDS